jgi:hypothetical protein
MIHAISIISFHLRCMLKGSAWIEMKNNLIQFIERKTHFKTIWHARMSLALNERM